MGTCWSGSDYEPNDPSKSPEAKSQPESEQDDEKKSQEIANELPLPGQCDIDCTFNLQTDLETLKKRHSQYQELMPRDFVDVKCNDVSADDIKSSSISVMQFNMLADGLCGAYSAVQNEKTFLGVDKECLFWTYRGLRIVEEIARFEPDICAVEECDQSEFIMKYLSKMGYASEFQTKGKVSPMSKVAKGLSKERGKEVTMNNDGVLLLYKEKKFSLCGDVQRINPDNDQKIWGLAVPLKVSAIGQEVLFVVTHLKSTKSQEGEELRERQINLLLGELVKNDKKLPVIVCTDLNANPVVNKKGYEPLCYRSLTNPEGLAYVSIYKQALGDEPEYTTFKKRETGVNKHTLDYILMKGGKWNVTQYLKIPQVIADENTQQGLVPDWNYPSDHYSIMARLTWK